MDRPRLVRLEAAKHPGDQAFHPQPRRNTTMPRKGITQAPPPLEFPNPPCSLCGRETVEIRGRFRCRNCRCSWDADTAHLYPGQLDGPVEEVA
ncbi:hypothetical protein MOQ72_29330 [Saccharopolyspora sp. K220]|uniref:hypothetical protein n=1 Tax=Saccharopolyspora soli TaxID=2926618 RepID=UPI001F5738C1|nr:hypothetical protein [Saccharopolyspora soli]MCI2421545.1 hypothetical protein [Saccharopolyspora soli]